MRSSSSDSYLEANRIMAEGDAAGEIQVQNTGILSEIRTKLRNWAVRQAGDKFDSSIESQYGIEYYVQYHILAGAILMKYWIRFWIRY